MSARLNALKSAHCKSEGCALRLSVKGSSNPQLAVVNVCWFWSDPYGYDTKANHPEPTLLLRKNSLSRPQLSRRYLWCTKAR